MDGVNLRDPLRDGASKAELSAIITGAWTARTDRGAVDRLTRRDGLPFIPLTALKNDPHLEMHTRGG
jgi:cyclic pyranopterin phosphate synthase